MIICVCVCVYFKPVSWLSHWLLACSAGVSLVAGGPGRQPAHAHALLEVGRQPGGGDVAATLGTGAVELLLLGERLAEDVQAGAVLDAVHLVAGLGEYQAHLGGAVHLETLAKYDVVDEAVEEPVLVAGGWWRGAGGAGGGGLERHVDWR